MPPPPPPHPTISPVQVSNSPPLPSTAWSTALISLHESSDGLPEPPCGGLKHLLQSRPKLLLHPSFCSHHLLTAAASTMEALNIAHLDSMSPACEARGQGTLHLTSSLHRGAHSLHSRDGLLAQIRACM